MHDVRERSFECRFDSATRRRTAHVVAWDAREAAQLFEAELRAEGVEEEGRVVVAPARAGDRARARRQRRRAS